MDLGAVYTVFKVSTKGGSRQYLDHFVTSYLLRYSLDDVTWTFVPYSVHKFDFPGNSDRFIAVEHDLFPPVEGRHFAIEVVAFNLVWAALRWELYGYKNESGMKLRIIIVDKNCNVSAYC